VSSGRDQKDLSQMSPASPRFLNSMDIWQNYLISWFKMSRAYYENAIKVNEHWIKAFWDPWPSKIDVERKATAKVE
jgi:hypothetical protein